MDDPFIVDVEKHAGKKCSLEFRVDGRVLKKNDVTWRMDDVEGANDDKTTPSR